jgi:hypothetical protein
LWLAVGPVISVPRPACGERPPGPKGRRERGFGATSTVALQTPLSRRADAPTSPRGRGEVKRKKVRLAPPSLVARGWARDLCASPRLRGEAAGAEGPGGLNDPQESHAETRTEMDQRAERNASKDRYWKSARRRMAQARTKKERTRRFSVLAW